MEYGSEPNRLLLHRCIGRILGSFCQTKTREQLVPQDNGSGSPELTKSVRNSPSMSNITLVMHKISALGGPTQNRFAASIAASKYRRRPPLYSFFLNLSGPRRLRVTKPARPDSIQ